MSEHDRRTAAADSYSLTEFHVGDRVQTLEGLPGKIDLINDGKYSSVTYFITLDNGMGGGEYAEREVFPLGGIVTALVEHTAADDYPELGTILSDRLPLSHSISASEYFGGRVTGSLSGQTPVSTWDDLPEQFQCQGCTFTGSLHPVTTGLGTQMDLCPRCGAASPYDPVQPEGWPVAARRNVVAFYLPPVDSTDAPQAPADDRQGQGYQDGFQDAVAINTRQPAANDAEYVVGYNLGWADGIKNHTSAPEIGMTTPDAFSTLGGAFTDFMQGKPPQGQEEGRNYSFDWCRYRRSTHCYYPHNLDVEATKEAGYQVWIPEDRGICPRVKWEDQQACPAPSEPGPNVSGGGPDATVSWADGGQRLHGTLQQALASRDPLVLDPEFRFNMISAWKDVRAKAKKIKAEGGVRILSVKDNVVVSQVKGDTHVYQSELVRMPGSKSSVANWNCGCAWAAYSWGRSGRWKKYEGRMCAHALATQYEMQSRGMFGREVHEDSKQPAWMDPTMPVRQDGDFDKDKSRYSSLRAVEAFDDDESPAMLIAADLLSQGTSPEQVLSYLVGLGVRNAPLVVQAASDSSFMAKVRGIITRLFVRDHKVVDAAGNNLDNVPIKHPDFDPRRGLSFHATASLGVTAAASEDAYWVHSDLAGDALIKRVLSPTEATYFYLDPHTGQWVQDNQWAYLSVVGSAHAEQISKDRAKQIAASHFSTIIASLVAALNATDQAYVDEVQGLAFRDEEQITPLLKGLAARFGGDMRGLKFRMKGHVWEDGEFHEDGRTMAAKVERIMAAKGVVAQKAAATISDSLRFTMTFPEDVYSEAVEDVMSSLASTGNVPMVGKAKNYWNTNSDYNGINISMLSPTSSMWELQFHTSKSFSAKMANHVLLEKFTEEQDPSKRRDLYDQMADRMSNVSQPPGAKDIGKAWMRSTLNARPMVANKTALDEWGILLPGELPYDGGEPALPVAYGDEDDLDDATLFAADSIAQAFAAQQRAGVQVTAFRTAPGDPFEHNVGDETTREYHDSIQHQTMPDGERYPYDKPVYDKSLWSNSGAVMDEDDWKRLKHSGLVLAADSEHAEMLSAPVQVGDKWVIYAQNGREVARSTSKELLEDYRQQRVSALLANQSPAVTAQVLAPQEFAEAVLAEYHQMGDTPQATAFGDDPTHAEAVEVLAAVLDPIPTPEMAEMVTAATAEVPFVAGDPRLSWLMRDGGKGGPEEKDIAAAAKAYLAKTALKDFTPAERAQIIDEGLDVQAANLDRLDIAGTHYVALEQTLAAQDKNDSDNDGMMWF